MNETNKKVIDTNKRLKLIIVDPQGNMDVNYYEDYPYEQVHFQLLRNYINNKSLSFSLKYDLKNADKLYREEMVQSEMVTRSNIESRVFPLIKLFNKNGYMLFLNMTDYKNYNNAKLHTGIVNLPIDIEHLSETHKQILKKLSNEIIVDPTLSSPKTDKLFFSKLPVTYYDKGTKEIYETGLGLDEIFLEQKEDYKHM